MTYHMQLTGYVGGASFNAREVRRVLAQYPGKHVDILIDSFGGSLAEGLSICGALRDHGDVTVHFRGMNASAATLASMGAKKVTIAPESMYLVHKVSMGFFDWADRNSDQLDEFIKLLQSTKEDLDTMDRSIAELYASRCKKPAKDLLGLMKAEKWITAADAKTWGFVDEITTAADSQQPTATNHQPTANNQQQPTITRAQADGFRTLGLPLPPVAIEPEARSLVAEIAKSIIEPIKSLLKPKDMEQTQPTNNQTQTPNQTQPTNNQQPPTNNQTASAPAPDSGVNAVNTNQSTAQSQQPTADNQQPEDLQARIDRLEAENKALKAKLPAEQTTNVVAQPTAQQSQQPQDAFSRFMQTGKNARALFDSIP